MGKIAVIVPIYNVEPYIHRCIDSILNQTYSNLELILIDDGSPDNCGAICDEYALKDSRIHVIHQENSGLSAARNAGIDWVFANSDSQWLTFIDSDDWIHPQMLEILLRNARRESAGISVCGYLETNGMIPDVLSQQTEGIVWIPEDFFLKHNTNAVIACAKLYEKSLFQDIRYPVGKLHEDEFITYKLLFKQKHIVVTDEPLYYYFQNQTGITKSVWNPGRMDALEALEEQLVFAEQIGSLKLRERAADTYVWCILQNLGQIKEQNQDDEMIFECRDELRRKLRRILREPVNRKKYAFTKENIWIYEEAYPITFAWGVIRVVFRVMKKLLKSR